MTQHQLLAYCTETEKDNLEIVKEHMRYNPLELSYASDRIKESKEIILELAKEFDVCLGVLDLPLRSDPDVIQACLAKRPHDEVYILTEDQAKKRTPTSMEEDPLFYLSGIYAEERRKRGIESDE